MTIGDSILRTVITNAAKPGVHNDDYGVAWYRGMISAAQHDEKVDAGLVEQAGRVVDALRARRDDRAMAIARRK